METVTLWNGSAPCWWHLAQSRIAWVLARELMRLDARADLQAAPQRRLHHDNLDATVLGAAVLGVVGCDRFPAAVTDARNAGVVDSEALEHLLDRRGTLGGKRLVRGCIAGAIGVPFDADRDRRERLQHHGELLELLHRLRLERRRGGVEVDLVEAVALAEGSVAAV